MAEVCDIAYVVQVEQLLREVDALRGQSLTLDPKERQKLPDADTVQSEFDRWLVEMPEQRALTPEDMERAELRQLTLGR